MNLENFVVTTTAILVLSIVSVFAFMAFLGAYDMITWTSCEHKYEDVEYSIIWWCKVKYNWEYIPESLYEKAFEQNFNINK